MFDDRPASKLVKAKKFKKRMSPADARRLKKAAAELINTNEDLGGMVCQSYHKRRRRAVFVNPSHPERGSITYVSPD